MRSVQKLGSGSMGVLLVAAGLGSASLAASAADAETTSQAAPPGFTMSRTGDAHDFDYFVGGWTVKQRKLKQRGVGSTDWDEFPAALCMTLYLDGQATVDELYMPTRKVAGLTVRGFDVHTHQWSIYWLSSNDASGTLDPVVGGFQGNHGEFYGTDEDDHRPIKVRFTWDKMDRDHARWAQAFSYDNRTWETNWVADFTRADTSATCRDGQPKRS